MVSPESPSSLSSTPSTGYHFHVFQTWVWLNHAWRTLIFEPPPSSSLVNSDHCSFRLNEALNHATITIDPPSRAILVSLAKKIDTFIIDVAKMRRLQKKLNQGESVLSRSDGHFILSGLICCILLDRLLWVLDVNVPHQHYQNRDITHDADDERVRVYKDSLRRIEDVRVATGVNQAFNILQIPHQVCDDGGIDTTTSSHMGLAFGTWHTSQSELHAIMSNCCFAAVACIGSLRPADDRGFHELIDHFQTFNNGSLFYRKLKAMGHKKDFASWQLWYQAIGVSPLALLNRRFVNSDTHISINELIMSITERVGTIPIQVWNAEKAVYRNLFNLFVIWTDCVQEGISLQSQQRVREAFRSLFDQLYNLEPGDGIVVDVKYKTSFQGMGSPSQPVHEATAILKALSGHPNAEEEEEEQEQEEQESTSLLRRKRVPQLKVLVEEDPSETSVQHATVEYDPVEDEAIVDDPFQDNPAQDTANEDAANENDANEDDANEDDANEDNANEDAANEDNANEDDNEDDANGDDANEDAANGDANEDNANEDAANRDDATQHDATQHDATQHDATQQERNSEEQRVGANDTNLSAKPKHVAKENEYVAGEEQEDSTVLSTSTQSQHELVLFLKSFDRGDFNQLGPSRSHSSNIRSYVGLGSRNLSVWSYRPFMHSNIEFYETIWSLTWTDGMFDYRELEDLVSSLSFRGGGQSSSQSIFGLWVNTIAALESLSIQEQRKLLAHSNIQYTTTSNCGPELSISNALKSLGVSFMRPVTIQDNRDGNKYTTSLLELLARTKNTRLDYRVEIAINHPPPVYLLKMDLSNQIGLANRAKVIYSTPPDRYVGSNGHSLPIWVRIVTGAQLWVWKDQDEKETSCLLRTGDVFLLHANTPFTTITLTDTVLVYGRFITLFNFRETLARPRKNRRDLDQFLLQLAGFVHYSMTSPSLDPDLVKLYYVEDNDLECLIHWLISSVSGKEAHFWASKLITDRPGMLDRVRKLVSKA